MPQSQLDRALGVRPGRGAAALGGLVGGVLGCMAFFRNLGVLAYGGGMAGGLVLFALLVVGGAALGALIGSVVGAFLTGLHDPADPEE